MICKWNLILQVVRENKARTLQERPIYFIGHFRPSHRSCMETQLNRKRLGFIQNEIGTRKSPFYSNTHKNKSYHVGCKILIVW